MQDEMEKELNCFCRKKKLVVLEKVSKGYSSEVFKVKAKNGKFFALKIEGEKSRRKEMVEKEARNLLLANSIGIGPKLFSFDLKKRIVLMELIEGITFNRWIEKDLQKKELERCIAELLKQARKLDKFGLSHGQLGGKGKNILVKKNCLPVIIDFEKASANRRARNLFQLKAFLFFNPNSLISNRVKELLGGKDVERFEHMI